MNIKMLDNNTVGIELDGVEHKVTRSQARMIANKLMATIEEKEDYLSLEKGDTVYYVNIDEGMVEKAIIFSIHIKDNKVDSFSCDFPDCNDFDEFKGSALGNSFFIDKSRAEDELKRA